MKSVIYFFIGVLAIISFVSVPIGVFFLFLGLNGRLADAERSLNVSAGLSLFAIGMAPAILAMLLLVLTGHIRVRFGIRHLLWLTLFIAIALSWLLWMSRG